MRGSGRDFTSGVSEPQMHGEVNRITLFVVSVTFFSLHLQDEQYQTPDRTALVRESHCIKCSSERHYFFFVVSLPFLHLTYLFALHQMVKWTALLFLSFLYHFSFNTSLHFISFFLFLFGVLGFHIGELYTCEEANCMVEGNESQHNSKWTSLVNNFQRVHITFIHKIIKHGKHHFCTACPHGRNCMLMPEHHHVSLQSNESL